MSDQVKPPRVVLSGMRTTGSLHVGHYFGTLRNWIELQDKAKCYFGAMNLHALTDAYKTPEVAKIYNRSYIIDWIAFGLSPEKCTFFVQSEVPAHIELATLFGMITPLGWLERVNTFKDAEEELKAKDAYNLGRLGYPVLQAADIAVYKADAVPVGADQVAHLELSREIVRRFNFLYKAKLPEPRALLTSTPSVNGLDGRKMSKSYNNTIPLMAAPEEVIKLVKPMPTDPKRVRRNDPGDPEVCPVFSLHKLFSSDQDRAQVVGGCTTAQMGCLDCKMILCKNISQFNEKPRKLQAELLADSKRVDQIIGDGNAMANKVTSQTMKEVKAAMGID